jgi:hypothetical protein
MITISDEKINSMIEAMKAGENWAIGLTVGSICFGCGPAAEAAGYDRNSAEGRLFISEAYDVLERCDIRTDDKGRITSILPKMLAMKKSERRRVARIVAKEVL